MTRTSNNILLIAVIATLCASAHCFAAPRINVGVSSRGLLSTATEQPSVLESDFMLEDIKPIVSIGSDEKLKIINSFGLWAMAVSLLTGPIWWATMMLFQMYYKMNPEVDADRAAYDMTGKIWSKVWLRMTMSYPQHLGESITEGPCLYVANHASWLDIPVLCTVLNPVFKFISKAELTKVPCIGHQLNGGNHILIDRTDRRSQLKTFRDGVSWLKKGIPLMAFPEGQRSKDGRLAKFKGGVFAMALREKVPIVPISLAHTHAVMPSNSLFPVQAGHGKLQVYVHPPISTQDPSLTEEELSAQVRNAILSKLPPSQHPLPKEEEKVIEIATEIESKKKIVVEIAKDADVQEDVEQSKQLA